MYLKKKKLIINKMLFLLIQIAIGFETDKHLTHLIL